MQDIPTISARHAAAAEIPAILLRRSRLSRCLAAMRRFASANRSPWLRICDTLPFQELSQALFSAIYQVRDLLHRFSHDLRGLRIAHALKTGEIERLAIVRVHIAHTGMPYAVPLGRPDDLLRQGPGIRRGRQLVQTESEPPPAFTAQRHVPRRLIEVCLEAAVPDLRLFRKQIGKDVDHQLLRLVDVVQVAVDV